MPSIVGTGTAGLSAATRAEISTAIAEALGAAGIEAAYISETTADPPAAPDGSKGAKRIDDGSWQRLERVGGVWVAVGVPLLGRGSNREVLTSWYSTIEAALSSGAKTVLLDDDKTPTTTVSVPAGVHLLDRGGSLTFTGQPDSTKVALHLNNPNVTVENIRINVTSGDYRRAIQHRASYTRSIRVVINMTNTPAGSGVGILASALPTLLTGVQIIEPDITCTNAPSFMGVNVSGCPDALVQNPYVHDVVTTAPNKLDWGVYIAQLNDGLLLDGATVMNCTIGGVHSNDGGSNPKAKRKRFRNINVKDVQFIGFAAETFEGLDVDGVHVDGAGLPMSIGEFGVGDTGGNLKNVYLANVTTAIGADAEMLAVNATNTRFDVTFGPAGNAVRGAVVNGANVEINAQFSGRRPVIAAQFNTAAVNGRFNADVPELDAADIETTQSAVLLLSPGSVFRGRVKHGTTNTNTNPVLIGGSAHGARVAYGSELDGTGRPVRISSGAQGARVERALFGTRNALGVNDAGTGTFIDAPQGPTDLLGTGLSAANTKRRTLSATAGWYRLVRIQNTNPITGSENTMFTGRLLAAPQIGSNGIASTIIDFAFAARGGTTPIFTRQGDAAIEFRVYQTADGWRDVYINVPAFTSFLTFDYVLHSGTEYFAASDPTADGTLTLLWGSTTGTVQSVYIGQNKVMVSGAATSIIRTVTAKTASYQMTATDDVIRLFTGSAGFVVTLPDVTTVTLGRVFTLKNAGSNAASLACTGTQYVDGNASTAVPALGSLTVITNHNRTGWDIIGKT
jgi:hypothetical protein